MSTLSLSMWIVNISLTIIAALVAYLVIMGIMALWHKPKKPVPKGKTPAWKVWDPHHKVYHTLFMVPMEAIDWETYKFLAKARGISVAKYIGMILDENADSARKKMDPNVQARLNAGNKPAGQPQQGGKPQMPQGGGNGRPPFNDE